MTVFVEMVQDVSASRRLRSGAALMNACCCGYCCFSSDGRLGCRASNGQYEPVAADASKREWDEPAHPSITFGARARILTGLSCCYAVWFGQSFGITLFISVYSYLTLYLHLPPSSIENKPLSTTYVLMESEIRPVVARRRREKRKLRAVESIIDVKVEVFCVETAMWLVEVPGCEIFRLM